MNSRPALLLILALLAGRHAVAQALFTGNPVGGDVAAGERVYAQSCLSCHGARLEGSPFGPALVGQTFMNRWRSRPAHELLTQMRNTMPPRGAGTVAPDAYAHLLAFLERANLQGPPTLAALSLVPSPPASGAPDQQAAPLPADVAQRLSRLAPVTDTLLAAPPDAAWLMWRRTADAAGFSPLRQIDRSNVQSLRQVWRLKLDPSANEITPLVHDGVLFVYSGSALQAIDAATGKLLWRHARGGAGSAVGRWLNSYGGQRQRVRSIALYGHSVFAPTPDGHVLALDARTGKLLWEKSVTGEGANSGLNFTSGPLVAQGVVMIGASLGLTNKGGCFIVGLDAATGAELWRFHTIARPGTPDGDTWNGAPVTERFGGGVWTTGSYDPQLDLAYFGIGNTYNTATLLEPRAGTGGVSKNDGLYTNATIALRPRTGQLVWHHQHHRRDVWDQDWAFEQTLVTLGSGVNARRAVVTGGKTAVFEALDAATGQFLFAHDSGLTNLFASIDPATGEKHTNPALEPVAGKALLLCPGNLGARNWPATSLNPATRTLFIPMLESCADYTYQRRGRDEIANGGTDIRFSPRLRPQGDGQLGRMVALDLDTRRVAWTHRQRLPLASSLLATGGGLVFMADLGRNLSAHDQITGTRLWNVRLPAAAESTPITYAVGNRQYIAVVAGEGSHLGSYNRGLVDGLGEQNTEIELVVFALARPEQRLP